MNTASVGNLSIPYSRGKQLGASGGGLVFARESSADQSTSGLRRLAGHPPNRSHAVLTYSSTTLLRADATGGNIDIYV
jgi:hypothetical protein